MKLSKLLIIMLALLSPTAYADDLAIKLHKAVVGKVDRPYLGIFLVAKGDKIIYEKVHGNFGNPKINNQFILGSISKQFASTMILRFVDEGKINLDAPIKTYLPELSDDWAEIVTVRHLLSHRSGIVSLGQPLEFQPGTQTKYVKVLPYYLISKIVEKISGKDYEISLNELFSLASMKESGLVISGTLAGNRKKYPNIPRAFDQDDDTGKISELKIIEPYAQRYCPCCGVISTAHDLLHWNRALHTGKLMSAKSYKQMTTLYGSFGHHAYTEVGYGLGLQLIDEDGFLEINHHGYGAGLISSIFYYPESEISIIALENVTHTWRGDRMRIFHNHDSLRAVVREHIIKSITPT